MDAMKEIKDKLECISYLLKEIEDILCKQCQNMSEPSAKAPTSTITRRLNAVSAKCAATQTSKKENSAAGKIVKNDYLPPNYVKREEPGRKRTSTRVSECSGSNTGKTNVKKIHEKNEHEVAYDFSCSESNGYLKNDHVQKETAHDQFVRKINDIKEKCMSYFEDINRSD